jgi:pimeloyl-ACP methyl ester carboxylesterase
MPARYVLTALSLKQVGVATARTAEPPAGLAALAQRYDPDVIDVPGGRGLVRLRVGSDEWDARLTARRMRLVPARPDDQPDAFISADPTTWRAVCEDVRGGMAAFQKGRLRMRGSLHLGVGLLAATNGSDDPGRLRFDKLATRSGRISILSAGAGPDVVLCLHGLGATKASFLSTVAALAGRYRVVAMDLPGFGESDKPIGAPYNAEWFARCAFDTLDSLGVQAAHIVGNSMGGRVAIETGLMQRERVRGLVMLSPALAWLRDRRWAPVVRMLRPELGLLQMAPRPVVERVVRRLVPGGDRGWSAAGVDEFLRAYLTPRGRAAFYAAARNIYLDEPHGDDGFWKRLAGLSTDSMFVWGRRDTLVPIAFMKHVERALPSARHVELDCGHVPQMERPRETHAAMLDFLADR